MRRTLCSFTPVLLCLSIYSNLGKMLLVPSGRWHVSLGISLSARKLAQTPQSSNKIVLRQYQSKWDHSKSKNPHHYQLELKKNKSNICFFYIKIALSSYLFQPWPTKQPNSQYRWKMASISQNQSRCTKTYLDTSLFFSQKKKRNTLSRPISIQ